MGRVEDSEAATKHSSHPQSRFVRVFAGKTPDQIRKTFNIRSDYTPEEEEEVRKEHKDLIE